MSATIVAPNGSGERDRPVFGPTHSTTGMGDQCALTNQLTGGTGQEVMLLPAMLDMGMTIVAPDYQGLGTPGDHAYLTNQASGRNVLDAIRAARHLDGTGVTADSPAVAWGHSQGGGAAAFAAELQPTYAPDVNLVGAIVGAPTSDLRAHARDHVQRSTPVEELRPPDHRWASDRISGAGLGRRALERRRAGSARGGEHQLSSTT